MLNGKRSSGTSIQVKKMSKLRNIYTLYWRAGLGWAGLGAVISPLIYSGQMMNVSPVPVTLRRCSLLTGTQSLDPSHLQQQMNNWKMSRWPAPQFAVICQAVLAVTLFRKRLVPAFCSAENFKNLQNCSGHFRNNKLLCPGGSGVSAPLLPAPFFSVATCRNILKDLLCSFFLYLYL